MSDAQAAYEAAREKQKAKEEEEIAAFLEERERQREQDERELEELKERRDRRREERVEEEQRMQDMRLLEEKRRKEEEEANKAKSEEVKKRREAAKLKKLMGGGGGLLTGKQGGRNFTIEKKPVDDSPLAAVTGKPGGPDPAEILARKEEHMAPFRVELELEDMDASAMRARIHEWHTRMAHNQADIYDMEERKKVQDYDLKELHERQKQHLRRKATRMGLDPEEYANAKHPPKKQVASAYDRQIDRRSYGERAQVYVPPAPKPPKVYHGSARPPSEWGVTAKAEEIEHLRKNAPERKYVEEAVVEGAKPPVPVVPPKLPSPDPEPAAAAAAPPAAAEEAPAAE